MGHGGGGGRVACVAAGSPYLMGVGVGEGSLPLDHGFHLPLRPRVRLLPRQPAVVPNAAVLDRTESFVSLKILALAVR
jgi:hypothetical protein